MDRKGLFERLHHLFRWGDRTTNSTVAKFEDLTPEEGLAKAKKDLEWAKNGQDKCTSDWSYWSYDKSIALYTVMITVFEMLIEEPDREFPNIEWEGYTLEGFNWAMKEWARNQ